MPPGLIEEDVPATLLRQALRINPVTETALAKWRDVETSNALPGRSDSIDANNEMVLARGLGDEDRQASRDEKGNRRAGATGKSRNLLIKVLGTYPDYRRRQRVW
jgi:hypothetical protein